MVRWFVIVGLAAGVVLYGLYGFNSFREHAIATFFANNKPPPAHISAAEVTTQAAPRYAPGIGSLSAVHQVTINPEVGGRVTKIFFEPGAAVEAGQPLFSSTMPPNEATLQNYEAQARWAQISLQRASQLARTITRRRRASTKSRASSTRPGRRFSRPRR